MHLFHELRVDRRGRAHLERRDEVLEPRFAHGDVALADVGHDRGLQRRVPDQLVVEQDVGVGLVDGDRDGRGERREGIAEGLGIGAILISEGRAPFDQVSIDVGYRLGIVAKLLFARDHVPEQASVLRDVVGGAELQERAVEVAVAEEEPARVVVRPRRPLETVGELGGRGRRRGRRGRRSRSDAWGHRRGDGGGRGRRNRVSGGRGRRRLREGEARHQQRCDDPDDVSIHDSAPQSRGRKR